MAFDHFGVLGVLIPKKKNITFVPVLVRLIWNVCMSQQSCA